MQFEIISQGIYIYLTQIHTLLQHINLILKYLHIKNIQIELVSSSEYEYLDAIGPNKLKNTS
jgi:hypothetical protein